jgi:L-amino acid N-acyltransferase YncA
MTLMVRAASLADADAIAAIYNQGIADRVGTFETEPRTRDQIESWFDGRHPIVVIEDAGEVVAFASTSSYRRRPCYAGVAEFSVYVARNRRGTGAGRLAMTALLDAAEAAGYWKLISRIFPENTASRALMAKVGFREVGVYRRHGKLDGVWRDCVIVERLLGEAAE